MVRRQSEAECAEVMRAPDPGSRSAAWHGQIRKSNVRLGVRSVSASLIGRLGSSAFRLSTVPVSMSLAGSRFSSESAQGPFHHGVRGRGGTIFTAALPSNRRQIQADTRTHLIHRPARDIIPPLGGARVPPIAFDPARSSCRCDVSGPAELGAVNPDAVHDHGQPACQRDDCFLHSAVPGNLHRPRLEP